MITNRFCYLASCNSSHPTEKQPGVFADAADIEKLSFLWGCYVWTLQQLLGHLLERNWPYNKATAEELQTNS